MSAHNLADQLRWFLESKPHVPPPRPAYPNSVAADFQDQTDDEALAATGTGQDAQQASTQQPRPVQSPTSAAASHAPCAEPTADMVRLRTAPSPARRPQLANPKPAPAAGGPDTLLHSAPPALRSHGDSDDDDDLFVPLSQTLAGTKVTEPADRTLDFHAADLPRKFRHVTTPASSAQSPARKKLNRDEYDTIDLTDDIEIDDDWEVKVTKSAAKAKPSEHNISSPIQAGRKRKSDEYRSDLLSPYGMRRKSPTVGQHKPPCTAAKRATKPASPKPQPAEEDLSRYFSSQEEDASCHDSVLDSGASGPSRSAPTRRQRISVADSIVDSEEEMEIDDVALFDAPAVSESRSRAPKLDTIRELLIHKSPSPKLPANHYSQPAAVQARQDTRHLGNKDKAPTIKTPATVAEPSTPAPPFKSSGTFELSALSQSSKLKSNDLIIDSELEPLGLDESKKRDDQNDQDRARQLEALKKFAALTSANLRVFWDELLDSKNQAKLACARAAEEDITNLALTQKKVQACISRMRALQDLVDARKEHVSLGSAKAKLTATLFDVMEDEELGDIQEIAAQVQKATKALKENEVSMHRMIHQCGIDLDKFMMAEREPSPPRPNRINVSSTQTPKATVLSLQNDFHDPAFAYSGQGRRQSPLREVSPVRKSPSPRKANLGRPRSLERAYKAPHQSHHAVEFDDGFDDDDALEAEMSAAASVPSTMAPSRPVLAQRSGNEMGPPPLNFTSKHSRPSDSQKEFSHAWSADVKSVLAHRFRLKGFRPNQLNAINATLGGKDVFVLMPTGGGKSLCYQLPALVQSGESKGVTVVISPLLSLMEDQVSHLEKLQIQAKLINGSTDIQARQAILTALRSARAESLVQLLYVTPEMLRKSPAIVSVLEHLHRNRKLARLVIDEAHCVSQWGHDFRPDYKELGQFREQFPGVPLMALTATATENVRADVIHNLKMQGCDVLTQSFNRPNLFYEMRDKRKEKDMLDEIAGIIKKEHRGQSGIIYCLSKKTCEKVAEALTTEHKIKAHHYHAGMEAQDKSTVQRKWQAREYQVIVATIAFGMGIDKADVRFVIHHSIPKSLEGYYQETGRAGRDGKSANCYLYYSFRDFKILEKMIWDSDDSSTEQKVRLTGMLKNVVRFCQNKLDCRRSLVLAYFGERFGKADCMGRCDNCKADAAYESRDLTSLSRLAIKLVRRLTRDLSPRQAGFTLLYFVDLFRGKGAVKDPDHKQLDEYGAGSDLDRTIAERLFHRLLIDDVFAEHNVVNKRGFAASYVILGRMHAAVERGNQRVVMQVPLAADGTTKAKTKQQTQSKIGAKIAPRPDSTYVSSPVQPINQSRSQTGGARVETYDSDEGFVVQDNAFEEDGISEDDAFELLRPSRRAPSRRTKTRVDREESFGPPITIDERLGQLDPIHQHIVENFVDEARKINQARYLERNLREVPFSDTILREMAIRFPLTKQAMCQLPDIDPDKVKVHGAAFFRLIESTKECLEKAMQADGDRPEDPNRRIVNVVDLVDSDEEDEARANVPSSAEEISPHFSVAPDVAAFNAQLQSYVNHEQPTRERPSPPSRRRREGSTSSRRSSGFVAKRKYTKASTGRKASGGARGKAKKPASAAGPSRGGGGGNQSRLTSGGAGSGTAAFGISAMPT